MFVTRRLFEPFCDQYLEPGWGVFASGGTFFGKNWVYQKKGATPLNTARPEKGQVFGGRQDSGTGQFFFGEGQFFFGER